MPPKSKLGRILIFVVISGVTLSLIVILIRVIPKKTDQSSQAALVTQSAVLDENANNTPTENKPVSPGLPKRLEIPEINVDTIVEYVGLSTEGDMAMNIKNSQDHVAWYKLGPRPGENGSAVIAGHYGTWKNGRGSVFDNLHKLSKGDKIYVEDEKGVRTVFKVRESRRYDPNADASDVFNSDDGKPHLNLVTCEGDWDTISESYSRRLVVFADKE